jgi:GPH family glycoside/pentoside/hexuronide:cation symporter
MTHAVGMSEGQQAIYWVWFVVFTVVMLPLITVLCNKFGRRPVMLACMIPAIFAGVAFWQIGFETVASVYIFSAFTCLSQMTFFTWYVSYAFDCIEIMELKTGERYEGAMTSLATMAQKIGTAISMLFTGWYLGFVGYNEEILDELAEFGGQSERAIQGITELIALFPALIFTVSCLLLVFYPISKKKYELLCAALENKKAGKEFSTDGFADILR